MSAPCKPGCTCRRHTRLRPKCEPGCTCKKHQRSAEACAKQSAAAKGRYFSPEHRARISASLTGKPLSPEHVEAMKTHGLTYHPHYHRYKAMMARCFNPANPVYYLYGGRGITVCEEWQDLATFCAWMDANLGPCPSGWSIDRIDNDGDYAPGNVRWASQSEQNSNRRKYKKKSGR